MFGYNKLDNIEYTFTITFSINTNEYLPRVMRQKICDTLLTLSSNSIIKFQKYDGKVIIAKLLTKNLTEFFLYLDFIHEMIEIPVILYDIRQILFDQLKSEMGDIILCLQLADAPLIHIYGRSKLIKQARQQLLKIIAEFFKLRTCINTNLYKKSDFLENGLVPIFDSFIFPNNSLIIQSYEVLPNISKKELLIFKDILHFERIVFEYLVYYERERMEDLLSFNECFIKEDRGNLICFGFDSNHFKHCLTELYEFYYKVVICIIEEEPQIIDNIFIIRNNNEIKLIGQYDKVIESISLEKCKASVTFYGNKEFEENISNSRGQGRVQKVLKETQVSFKSKDTTFGVQFDISGVSNKVAKALILLFEEKPTQMCFFVEEKNHKKLIGHGGKNIQKFMKKHKVYIKFMNEPERISLGYIGNVLIKTPKKNFEGLNKMKEEILGHGPEKKDLYVLPISDFIGLPTNNFRMLYNYVSIFISEKSIKYYEIPDSISYKSLIGKENQVIELEFSKKVFLKTWNEYEFKRVGMADWTNVLGSKNRSRQINLFRNESETDVLGVNEEDLVQKYD